MQKDYDPKLIVAQGYDRIGGRYGAQAGTSDAKLRQRYVSELTSRLPKGANLLDLGCGSGVPTTKQLAEHFTVTGVDISRRQVERARYNIPHATFICSDMEKAEFPQESFDAVTAFYSIIHLPREEHEGLLKRIAAWLPPGGYFFATLGVRSGESNRDDTHSLGVPMYWSSYDSKTNQRLVAEIGLEIVSARKETTRYEEIKETFLWLLAQKPMLDSSK